MELNPNILDNPALFWVKYIHNFIISIIKINILLAINKARLLMINKTSLAMSQFNAGILPSITSFFYPIETVLFSHLYLKPLPPS